MGLSLLIESIKGRPTGRAEEQCATSYLYSLGRVSATVRLLRCV
jgi:hypothetical protein